MAVVAQGAAGLGRCAGSGSGSSGGDGSDGGDGSYKSGSCSAGVGDDGAIWYDNAGSDRGGALQGNDDGFFRSSVVGHHCSGRAAVGLDGRCEPRGGRSPGSGLGRDNSGGMGAAAKLRVGAIRLALVAATSRGRKEVGGEVCCNSIDVAASKRCSSSHRRRRRTHERGANAPSTSTVGGSVTTVASAAGVLLTLLLAPASAVPTAVTAASQRDSATWPARRARSGQFARQVTVNESPHNYESVAYVPKSEWPSCFPEHCEGASYALCGLSARVGKRARASLIIGSTRL